MQSNGREARRTIWSKSLIYSSSLGVSGLEGKHFSDLE